MRLIDGLDELEALAGTTLGTSGWVTVTQEMVNTFSEVTSDHQWIHLDVERATRELETGGPIVQGLLTLSLIIRFRNEIARVQGARKVINYGLNRVRFMTPVLVGSRLRGTQTLLAANRVEPRVVRTTSSMAVAVEGVEKLACVAEAVTLVYA